MRLLKQLSVPMKMKPCSMTSFAPNSGDTLYAIACYELDDKNTYSGEIVIVDSEDLSVSCTIPADGGVFRVYRHPTERMLFAVTTDGKCMFIDDETLEVTTFVHPDKPYFTDGSVLDRLMAFTDDRGKVHVFDRCLQEPVGSVLAHELKVGSTKAECPAWSCVWLAENELVSVGDDGKLCHWDFRASFDAPTSSLKGPCEDGLVFVADRRDGIVAVGDYGQNYSLYDLRQGAKMNSIKLPGGVWHVDYNLEPTMGITAAACMQGGIAIFNSKHEVTAHAEGSRLSYGTAIHRRSTSSKIAVAEVEFDDRILNRYELELDEETGS